MTGFEVAVIGMSGRFPDANTIEEFWDNLKNGREGISFFSPEEDESRFNQPDISKHPNYVNAKGVVEGIEFFDPAFFDCTPREVEIMDPQQRFLYECVWEALEDAGYNSEAYPGVIGSYLGAATNLNWLFKVLSQRSDLGMNELSINSSEFFSTRISHKFNLRGPSFTVQSACSTSLVAIHLACQSLLSGECDMALAGGVRLNYPQKTGYVYQEGGIMSKDGHCRAFDTDASGTVGGNGAGVVLLKRVEDAINDGDNIYAMIKGSAVNNDGTRKVGFYAPSPEGQADVIKNALYLAEVEPESIGYVETHGTGTILGDPIEMAGLNMAFNTERKGFCRVGSVKSNIGHLDNAAGVAGLIKTVLALKHQQIPPTLHFDTPNPNIDFANSPFVVNTELVDWQPDDGPRRAGVSSFGMGGTNAHIVLEESPKYRTHEPSRPWQMLTLSAKTGTALQKMSENLATYLTTHPDLSLADVAYTLHVGRKDFKYRKMLLADTLEEAISQLKTSAQNSFGVMTGKASASSKEVVFMFPGQGSQYVNMGLNLYRTEPVFKGELDQCFAFLRQLTGANLQEIVYPKAGEASPLLQQTQYTQPILFAFEYALAKLLVSWGVRPAAMIGHSIGEYVAACISGIFTLEDALALVSQRGELMQSLPSGSMLSVPESETKLLELIGEQVSIAAVNGEASCVLAGTDAEIDRMEELLAGLGYQTMRLHTSHAFHSHMVEPILDEFRTRLGEVTFNPVTIPFVSNLTGDWVTDEVMTPEYWVRHLRETVRFGDGLAALSARSRDVVYLEVGPGKTLGTLVRRILSGEARQTVINTVRHPKEDHHDRCDLLTALGRCWVQGVPVNWTEFYQGEQRYRVSLPTYPFERKYLFLDQNVTHLQFTTERVTRDQLGQEQETQASYYVRTETDLEYCPPSSEKEEKIIQVFEQVLGIKGIGVNEDFFEIGGDSLRVMEVVAKLKKDFTVQLNDIFAHPTAAKLAEHVTISQDNLETLITRLKELNEQPTNNANVNVNTDGMVGVSPELRVKVDTYWQKVEQYKERNLEETRSYQNILLTGVTGYLGIFLFRDLLEMTDSRLHLIIRGADDLTVNERLVEKLNYYFEQDLLAKYADRVILYAGDLAAENLGLDLERYQTICNQIDCIIHSAGNVSHFGKYEDSYQGNVETTRRLIQFAKSGQLKDFNHISTLDVANGQIPNVTEMIFTENDCDLEQDLQAIYPKTKLEAEKLLLTERAQGLNVNIFRLGNVLFDSKTGKFQKNMEQNAVYSVIKAFVKLGLIPEGFGNLGISCVDQMSQSIVTLFNKQALINETYHLENRNLVNLSEILSSDELDLGVRVVSVDEFLNYVHENYENQELLPYISMLYTHLLNGEDLADEEVNGGTRVQILFDKTELVLQELGFIWPQTDQLQIRKMIQHCQEVKYI